MTRWCWAVATAVLVLGSCSESTSSADAPSQVRPPSSSALARTILDLTNAERRRAGVDTLDDDSELAEAARIQASQMVRAGRLAHDLPGAMYPGLQDRLSAVRYSWRAVGENIAFGQATAAAVMNDWMRSDGHRANILNRSFTEIGIGDATDSGGRRYYVQVFARPR